MLIDIGSEFRIARKIHECVCGLDIRPGTRYQRFVTIEDGVIEVTKEGDHIHSHEAEEAALDAYWDARIHEGC